jgi:hypothetical protein
MLLQCLQKAIRSTKERGVSRNKLPEMAVRKGAWGPKKLRNLPFLFFVAVSLFADLKFNPFTPNPSHPAHDGLSFPFSLKSFNCRVFAGGSENNFLFH